ncbi:Sister chromatid cohesion protein PDS5 B-A [Clonorchis sinensis]|uniref:Sister chromatid cohesion protein PDS5 B-A n=1 Tax=Clonorchis sinensis TaxID=79923 RepID=A0A8T1M7J7_CLOSI|nr:Sister chromatid cohesion protein PDS5 B-A [Clonorchis sinensis]
MKSVGYSIIYPPGCKELSESLRITDLRKRLNNSLLHDGNPALWDAFLGRFNDISEDIRKLCVHMVPQMIQHNPDLPRDQLLKCIQQRAYDQNDDVRLFVLRTVSSLINEAPLDTVANDLYQLLIGRCRDKSLSIRKEAATSLANMYKRLVQEPQPPADRLSAVVNGILHMYYHSSVDDKIIVERLFKSSLVPYHFNTSDRVRALLTCNGLLDEASVRAVREMFRMQYTVTVLLKDILHLLSTQDGKKISVAGGTDLMDRLIALTNVLPKTDHKTVEQLKRFFNKVHSDESLRLQLVKLTKPTCTCFEATKILRYLIKHIDNSSSSVTAGGAEAHAQYVRCVKILLERFAPVLFDKAFGQELVTQLLVIREKAAQSSSLGPSETLKALILLHSLSLYFTGILPTEGLASYLINILSDDSISADITAPPRSSSTTTSPTTTQEADPQTTHELALSVFCSLLNGPGPLCDNDSEVPDSCSYPLHTDSAYDLIGCTKDLLPLLKNFCSTGMTRLFPPVPCPVDSALQTLPPLQNGARLEEGKPARGKLKREVSQRCVYLAGLAWRRERRRAKLAIQALLALYKSAQRFRLAPEVEIKAAVDEVVKVCLACPSDSPDYIACLTALGRIALRLPGVYNREFKQFTTKSLIPDVLARDSEIEESGKVGSPDRSNAAKRKQNRTLNTYSNPAADWISDGCVPQSTRAKISATKFMSNWLRGLKIEEKPVAQAVIRLLHRIIIHNGDLTGQGKLAPGEMSRMRLVAATSWLKLAHSQCYVDSIEVDWYQSMTYILRDPCPQVRSHFLTKLNQGLYRLQLPLEYMAMFAHAPNVPDAMFKQRAKQLLAANIQRRRDFLDRYPSRLSDPKFLYALLPEFLLPYVIYLLAHVPDWTEPNDVDSLNRIKASLWFVMEPIVTRGHNFLFIRKIIERIKHTRDALAPEDAIANAKLYLTCDVALGLLLTRCSDLTIKDYIIDVKLPKSLFVATPTTFRNPDFEQLLNSSSRDAGSPTNVVRTPLIQFTPRKDTQTEKYMIPAELLKGKRRAPAASRSESTENVDNRSKPVPSQSCGPPVQTLATTVAAASSSKPTCSVATKQTKLVSYALPKTVSSGAATESVSVIGGAEQPSILLDRSLSPEQTTPRKRMHIVLDTPEVGLDTGGSSLKEHTMHLSNSMSRVKCQRLSDVPNKLPAKSPPFQVESSRFTAASKKPNIRSAPPRRELVQVALASRTRRPKSHQQTTKSALKTSIHSSTPSSTPTSARAPSTSPPPHPQALTRKRGRPPKGSTSTKQSSRQTRLSTLKSRK